MKIAVGIILSLFLGLMFMSLIVPSGPMHMSHGMSDCPFMAPETVVCAMNIGDHIGAWKSVFYTLIPPAFALFLTVGAALLVASTSPYLTVKWRLHLLPIHWRQLRETTYEYTFRPYQELFSSGLIHPKLF